MDPYHMNPPPPTPSSRAEADRWLAIAEKLLAGRDLVGSKTFAIRARESEPRLEAADQILALADTLIAGDKRINNSLPDWYAVLQLPPLTADVDLIATHYHGLAILLNPNRSRLCFADVAFQLVSDAWSVLSNPNRKNIYDNEIANVNIDIGNESEVRHNIQQNPRMDNNVNIDIGNESELRHNMSNPNRTQNPRMDNNFNINTSNNNENNPTVYGNEFQTPPPQQNLRNAKNSGFNANVGDNNGNSKGSGMGETFWTACPYCYNMYEYPKVYEECSMRCQNCRRAFHGAKIPAPPIQDGDTYTTWGFYPLGVEISMMEKNKGCVANWTPFSPMFACDKSVEVVEKKRGRRPGPVVYIEDDEDDVVFDDDNDGSEGSDDEWGSTRTRKRKSGRRGRGRKRGTSMRRNTRSNTEGVVNEVLEEGIAPKEVANLGKKQVGKVMKERGKLDLNVEFNNEGEEPVRGGAKGMLHGEEDGGIEGIGFFEGLDEFLSSLPILNVVGDDKVKAA